MERCKCVSEDEAGLRVYAMPPHVHDELAASRGDIGVDAEPLDVLVPMAWREGKTAAAVDLRGALPIRSM